MAEIILDDPAAGSIEVSGSEGVERVRRYVRAFALKAGLASQATEELVQASSELATNLSRYSVGGLVQCALHESPEHAAVEVLCTDIGPGIADINKAMTDGFSTGGGLGAGLSSAQRLADEFLIESTPEATSVRIRKWLPQS